LRTSIGVGFILALLAAPLAAQRVEFPTPVQPVQATSPYAVQPSPYTVPASPYAVPTTPAPYVAPANASPYSAAPTPSYGAPAPSYTAPPAYTSAPPPTYSPAAVGPPPAFDPYTSGGSITPAPPVAAPYGAAPPAAPYLQQPAPPYQPAPYDIQPSGENYWAKTQRLLQEISFEYTFLYGKQSDPNDLGINEAEISATFAFPMFGNIETPLLVTPGFQTDWLQGPVSGPPLPGPPVTAGGPDLPPRLYAAYLDFAWFPKCNEWLGGELGLQPGIWTDFHNVDSDSIRILGRGLATVALSPQLDIRFGVIYLDRVDVKILPAGGFYYRPTPDWDMYLVFPNPKVRKFMTAVGNTKWWWYVAGEYGGGSWTVERQTTDDRIDINDIRVIGGLEWETQTHIRGHIEAGYVFDREVVFVSGDPGSFKPDDTIMLRAGVSF
jgi:hypothetical protein